MSDTCTCGCGHGLAAEAVAAAGFTLTPDESVANAMRRSPEAAEVLRRLGIDTCCGGRLTLAQAAASAGISVDAVLAALATGREAGV